MGFFDTLRRALTGESAFQPTPREVEAAFLGVDADELPIAEGTPFDSAGEYDRQQWAKKLKRVLAGLPETRAEWPDVDAEAKSMGFDPEWVASHSLEEFTLLIRRAVADRHFTEAEHRKIDLARDLIGLTDAEAESILHAIIVEAESFFGKPVEGS